MEPNPDHPLAGIIRALHKIQQCNSELSHPELSSICKECGITVDDLWRGGFVVYSNSPYIKYVLTLASELVLDSIF